MPIDSAPFRFALLLGLSLFFGLAFEEFYGQSARKPPGGIRTFPLLALSGALLYRIDTTLKLPFAAGLLVIGVWLLAYYREQMRETDAGGTRDAELVALVCNALAFVIGPVALTEPPWVAVGATVAAVLLLTARERLHTLARRVAADEIVTAGKFLILTGIVLPLLPNHPVSTLTTITPYQAWLALLAVCTVSYASYLLQRYVAFRHSDLAVAFLGGLYSSTATTVVLARAANQSARVQAGIILATAVMYLRILVVVALFNLPLAASLAPWALLLSAGGLALAFIEWRRAPEAMPTGAGGPQPNPLELMPAVVFGVLFVVISLISSWANRHFGSLGIDAVAAVVGVTDIDPFVLSIAQGNASLPIHEAVVGILIATASNNLLKAGYAMAFAGWRASRPAVASLVLLATAAGAMAIAIG